MRRVALAWLIAAVCAAGSSAALAQTTSGRAESLEITARADELLASGKYRRAAQRYRNAIEIDETNERAYVGLSGALDALGRHEEALEMLRTAQSLLGWTADIGLQRGIHLSRLARWAEAVASLERALEAQPDSFDAAYYLGGARLATGDWAGAVDAYDRYLGSRPEALAGRDSAVRTRRAYALLNTGDYDSARRTLLEVLDADAEHLSARMLLFTTLAKQGDCDDALAMYDEIVRLAETAPTLRYNAAVCQFRVGDGRAALATLDGYGDGRAEPATALLLRARIQASFGNDKAARARYREAIAAGIPAEAELGAWLNGRGDHAGAVELLWPKVADTQDPDLLATAADALLAVADYDRAVSATSRLVELRSEARSWSLHGRVLLARKEWSAAESAYTRALETAPDQRDAGVGLRRALEHQATAAFRAGDRDTARQLLSRAVEADPGADAAAFNLALVAKDPKRVVALLAPRIDRLASPEPARLLLGRALYMTGDTEAARRELDAVIQSKRVDAALRRQALAQLAHVEAQAAPDHALALIARARKLAGGDADANARLDAVEASARLAHAEHIARRGSLAELPKALRQIDAAALDPAARPRLALLQVFGSGQRKDLRTALRALDGLTDEQLAAVAAPGVPATSLRHAIALELGARFMTRSADYRKYLRAHAKALASPGSGSKPASRFLTKWYYRLLAWATARSAGALARSLARDAPVSVQSPAFEHNAIVAEATTSAGRRPFTRAQKTRLEALAATVPEALANLAVDAHARGDHAAALDYLLEIPSGKRTREVTEWIRWKELVHGSR